MSLTGKQVFVLTSTPTIRDVVGRVLEAQDGLADARRDMVRDLARSFVLYAKSEAPKKTGDFADSIRFRTYQRGDVFGATITTAQPLGLWILGGTKPHPISATKANALVFFFNKIGRWLIVPKKGGFPSYYTETSLVSGKGHVMHPGTKPNPFLGRAQRKWMPVAREKMSAVGGQWRRTVMNTQVRTRKVTV